LQQLLPSHISTGYAADNAGYPVGYPVGYMDSCMNGYSASCAPCYIEGYTTTNIPSNLA